MNTTNTHNIYMIYILFCTDLFKMFIRNTLKMNEYTQSQHTYSTYTHSVTQKHHISFHLLNTTRSSDTHTWHDTRQNKGLIFCATRDTRGVCPFELFCCRAVILKTMKHKRKKGFLTTPVPVRKGKSVVWTQRDEVIWRKVTDGIWGVNGKRTDGAASDARIVSPHIPTKDT